MPYKDIEKAKEYKHKHYLEHKEEYKKRLQKHRAIHSRTAEYRRYTEFRRQRRKTLIGILGGVCVVDGCYDKTSLHIHHKNPKSKTHRKDWLNKGFDIRRVELLCSKHHIELHRKDYGRLISKMGKNKQNFIKALKKLILKYAKNVVKNFQRIGMNMRLGMHKKW